jgi:hypothetical protein
MTKVVDLSLPGALKASMKAETVKLVPLSRLSRWDRNYRVGNIDALIASIVRFGFRGALRVRKGIVYAGNQSLIALETMQANGAKAPPGIVVKGRKWLVPCIEIDDLGELESQAFAIADNRTHDLGQDDNERLAVLLRELGSELAGAAGFDDASIQALLEELQAPAEADAPRTGALAEAFGVPPFTVLDARQGYWSERKRAWLSLGIDAEIGRDDKLVFALSSQPIETYKAKERYEAALGRQATWEEFAAAHPEAIRQSGTSLFDPVLTEILISWFCPPIGSILDPFAGGSVRGVVAAILGRRYVGIELREEQVEANRRTWERIYVLLPDAMRSDIIAPEWVLGDSAGLRELVDGEFDFCLTCPPYLWLEEYSDDPRDLSAMGESEFFQAMARIVESAAALMRPDSFTAFVVGDVRRPDGTYVNFPGRLTSAFQDVGMSLYNEAAYVSPLGSLAVRARGIFSAARKLAKGHQNVLVYLKGDAKAAAARLGEVVMPDFSEETLPVEEFAAESLAEEAGRA